MSTVEAKLRVYKKYKDFIHNQDTFLHHEYDNNDDVSKLIAAYLVSPFCTRHFNHDTLMHLTPLREDFDRWSREQVLNVCSKMFFQTGLGQRNANEIKTTTINETIRNVIMKIIEGFRTHLYKRMHNNDFQTMLKYEESILNTIADHVSNKIHKQVTSVLPIDVNSMEWIEEVGNAIYMQITQDKEEIMNKCLKIFDGGPITLLLEHKEACIITNCKYTYILHLSKYAMMCQCFVKKETVIESNTYLASYVYQFRSLNDMTQSKYVNNTLNFSFHYQHLKER